MQKVKVEPFQVIGLSIRTTNEGGRGAQEIGALWQRFLGEGVLNKIPGRIDDTIYSIYADYEGDHTQPYTVILGCKVKSVDQVPEGMTSKSFDGGDYVTMSVRGDLSKGIIASQWMKIWEMDLDRAFTADFEVFGEKAQNPEDAEVDFFVAVR